MLSQDSTLASEALRIGATLSREYGIDPSPLYAAAGIDPEACSRPGARVSHEQAGLLWMRSIELAGDGEFGLKLGNSSKAKDYFVLGHSWSASDTLLDAMERMIRFEKVITSPYSTATLEEAGDVYRLTESFSDEVLENTQPEVHDANAASILALCRESLGEPLYPSRLALISPASHHRPLHYVTFGVDIEWGSDRNIMEFPAKVLEAELPGAVPAIADASDKIAAQYIEDFGSGTVSTQVRQLIVGLLPAGRADQETIASKLYRSASTLQRQLSSEGTSFRELLQTTRQGLAEEYLKDGEHSQAEVAFLVGFSDQSNFARAFKRWTGESPGQYQRSVGG